MYLPGFLYPNFTWDKNIALKIGGKSKVGELVGLMLRW